MVEPDTAFLPPPPPSASPNQTVGRGRGEHDNTQRPQLAPGQMRFGWRVCMFVVWALTIAVLSAVWNVTIQIGHHTVWLGPLGDPLPLVIRILPFVPPVVVLYAVMSNARWLVPAGVVAALCILGLGVADLGFYERLGWVEVATGTMSLLATIASLAGRVGRAPDGSAGSARP